MVNNNFMLVYTRHKRDSSKIIQSQKKNLKSVIKQYDLIKPLTDEIPKILKRKNTNLMAEVFKRHWLIKKKLSNQMSNKQINRLYDFLIRKCNFLGGKLIGAGGGGFFLMITQNKKKTIKLLKKNSINYLNFKIENKGSRVIKDV